MYVCFSRVALWCMRAVCCDRIYPHEPHAIPIFKRAPFFSKRNLDPSAKKRYIRTAYNNKKVCKQKKARVLRVQTTKQYTPTYAPFYYHFFGVAAEFLHFTFLSLVTTWSHSSFTNVGIVFREVSKGYI